MPPQRGNVNYPWCCVNGERLIPIYATRAGEDFRLGGDVIAPATQPDFEGVSGAAKGESRTTIHTQSIQKNQCEVHDLQLPKYQQQLERRNCFLLHQ